MQADSAVILMKHLRTSAHQPSARIKDRKQLFSDYKQCYTCKLEFEGKLNLMNHRKNMHPSNRKCIYFPDGKCKFGVDCWYVHEEELMDVDEEFEFKCYICGENF